MGNTSSADLAAWGANIVAALSWWFPGRGEQPTHSTNSEASQHNSQEEVAAEYRAQREASRLQLARLLQRREENMVGCIEELERELLISCLMTERDERLRGRLLELQGQYPVQLEDRNFGRQCDSRANEGDHNPADLVAHGEPLERRRGREVRRRDNSSTQSEAPSSTMVEEDRRPRQEIDTGRVVRRRSHGTLFTLRASSR